MALEIALSGDAVINKRLSICNEKNFEEIAELFRNADIGFTHLETVICDYDDTGVYPAAEAGGNWMRSPKFVAEELEWFGIDLVSHASNHALDYGYGGIRSTWQTLDEVGIGYAGTGEDLADASAPTFIETSHGRVSLISMTSSFPSWSRAGRTRRDMKGRPGSNAIRYDYVVNDEVMDQIKTFAVKSGLWCKEREDHLIMYRPGTSNSIHRFMKGNPNKNLISLNEADVQRNYREIVHASRQSDVTIAHLHTHEHAPEHGITVPPNSIQEFARGCIDAGASLVLFQGSHAPLRGIEIYDDTPIFYDPGDIFFMSNTVERVPHEFYERHRDGLECPIENATPSDGMMARGLTYPWGTSTLLSNEAIAYGGKDDLVNPKVNLFTGPGFIIPVCKFNQDHQVEMITLYPATWIKNPKSHEGIPKLAKRDEANKILKYLSGLSDMFGTSIDITNNVGRIRLISQ